MVKQSYDIECSVVNTDTEYDRHTIVFPPASPDKLITALSSFKWLRVLEQISPEFILEGRCNHRLNVSLWMYATVILPEPTFAPLSLVRYLSRFMSLSLVSVRLV